MEQKLIFEEWLKRKLSFDSYWYLKEPIILEYEFKGGRMGHPSNYAFVRFEVNPSESLSFQSTVSWDAGQPNDISLYESLVCEAIVDGLICNSTTPFTGCSLNLVAVKEDEVSSSPGAFYKATKKVMADLIETGKWGLSQYKNL
jgi:hypothetical protein